MKRWLLPATFILLTGNAPANAPIEVDVTGIRSTAGLVRVSICPEDRFLKPCAWTASSPAHPGIVTLIVNNVPPGRYAVQAFHDANGDGQLAQNWFGLPREGIGFSNDAMAKLRRPRFSIAAFDHGAAPQRIAVTVRYFLG